MATHLPSGVPLDWLSRHTPLASSHHMILMLCPVIHMHNPNGANFFAQTTKRTSFSVDCDLICHWFHFIYLL